MTTLRIQLFSSFFVALLLPVALFAQESTATPTATTEMLTPEIWYTTDFISGDIQVGDFVVGPGRSEVALSPGDTKTVMISVTNRISDNRVFKLEIADISGTADGSSALQVIEGERGPYSIRDYVSFPQEAITLQLGERAQLPLTITIPKDAEPGGYYGSVLVSTVQVGEAAETAAPRNPIVARVGSHVFLTVNGAQEIGGKTLSVTTIPSAAWYESGPITLGISYENNGSIHVNPYGELRIKNILGEEVGYVEIEPWFVLPKSIRTREVAWNREFLFGKYTALVSMNRGYDDVVDEVSVTFWVLPWKLVSLLFGVLFITFLLFRLFFRTFEFKRK